MMRLSRLLAQAGICSRRQAENLILNGMVTVNGTIIQELGTQVDEEHDEVRYRGQKIHIEQKRYFLFYKPVNCLCTVEDAFGRATVVDWFQQFPERLYPVGRLDANTSGLLLMSNDGDFVNHMIHPRYKISKTYEALVRGKVEEPDIERLLQGVLSEEGELLCADQVCLVRHLHEETVLDIVLHQGKKRQVRLMCAAIGHPVVALVRTEFAFLTLENLKPGEFRALTAEEVQRLQQCAEQGLPTANPNRGYERKSDEKSGNEKSRWMSTANPNRGYERKSDGKSGNAKSRWMPTANPNRGYERKSDGKSGNEKSRWMSTANPNRGYERKSDGKSGNGKGRWL